MMSYKIKESDYIAFEWPYGIFGPTIIVSNITEIFDDGGILVHWLQGYKSESEILSLDDILAVGDNNSGTHGIKGSTGKFLLLQPNNEVLIKNLKS